MVKSSDVWTPVLQRAQRSLSLVRLERDIDGVDFDDDSYVVGVGRKWVLLAEVPTARIEGYMAYRLSDITRVNFRKKELYHKVAEATGTWPPTPPETTIDLNNTRRLIETAASHATLVTLYTEDHDPDVCFIGAPVRYSDRHVWLEEIDSNGTWDESLSKWRLSDITRVDFSSVYEQDLLLLVAGEPPSRDGRY